MASLTSITLNQSSSSPLGSLASKHCHHNQNSFWHTAVGSVRSSSSASTRQRFSSQGLRIRSAATKQAKTPAEEDWKTKRELLLQKKVRSVDVKEALRLQKENNFVILDVRPEAEFREAHPAGAINVQIYRLIKEWTAWDIARRAAFAFFGIFAGTEENPEFISSVNSLYTKLQLALQGIKRGDLEPMHANIQPHDLSTPVVSSFSQGSSEYFSRIGVGTPAKSFYMVLDTGNWLPCGPCSNCY